MEIIPLSLFLNLVALVIYSMLTKEITSFTVAIISTLLLEGIHQPLELFLESPTTATLPFNLKILLWYGGFALTDFLIAALIVTITKYFSLAEQAETRLIVSIYCLLGALQVVRYLDRLLIDSNIMYLLYRYGVESLNYLISLVLLWHVAALCFSRYRYR